MGHKVYEVRLSNEETEQSSFLDKNNFIVWEAWVELTWNFVFA